MLFVALPEYPLYPKPVLASGLTSVQRLETSLLGLRREVQKVGFLPLYASLTGIGEMWNTFAPVPPQAAGYLSVVAQDQGRDVVVTEIPARPFTESGVFDPLTLKYLPILLHPWNRDMQADLAHYFSRVYAAQTHHVPDGIVILESLKNVPLGDATIGSQPLVRRQVFRAPSW